MRILQVANVRWFNAAADYALSLALGLRERGHDSVLAGIPGTPVMELAAARGVPSVPLAAPGGRPRRPVAWRRLRELAGGGWDVVNAHFSAGYPLLAASFRSRSPRTALVRTRGDARPPGGGPLNRFLYRRWTDGLIASGEAVRRGMIGPLGLSSARVRVVHYGVDTRRFRPGLPPPPGLAERLPPGGPVVGYVGRLDAVKGTGRLPEVLARVTAARPDARFLLAVRDGDLEVLRRGLAEAGVLPRTLVLGPTPDVAGVMGLLTAGLVSSVGSEVNARVLEELMACGVPTVATRVGVMPEIIEDGVSGILVPPGDPEALAGSLLRLLKEEHPRHTMADAARRRVEERFTLERMAEESLAGYREAAARRHERLVDRIP